MARTLGRLRAQVCSVACIGDKYSDAPGRGTARRARVTSSYHVLCTSGPTDSRTGAYIGGAMNDHLSAAKDVPRVIEALANGIRSTEEVTGQTRLPAYKVRAALR